jgi:molybdopterin molybdotransferase
MAGAPLLPVAEARARILAALTLTDVETLQLAQTLNRVLATDVIAQRTQPPADLSAMDGYALRASDAASVPATLTLIGEAPAGGAYESEVKHGEAVRIFTGAPVPDGADAVVIQEDTERIGERVIIREAPRLGAHIRRIGIDFRKGDVGLQKGRRLSPADIALAASMNVPKIEVFKRPVIAFFSTGNELVHPGDAIKPNQIVSANNDGLAVLIEQAGGVPLNLGIVPDDLEAIRMAATSARGRAQMLVTLGGASVGDHDLIQPALGNDGLAIDFWRIAMRPGKPLMFGHYGDMPMLGLPGNPVSALVCAWLFLNPAIARMQGADATLKTTLAELASPLKANDRREDYLRAKLEWRTGSLPLTTAYEMQDSSMLSALSGSDCLVIRPPHAPQASSGSQVEILLLR